MVGQPWKWHMLPTLGWGALALALQIKTRPRAWSCLDCSSEVTKNCSVCVPTFRLSSNHNPCAPFSHSKSHVKGVGADTTHLCQLLFKCHFPKAPLQTQKEPGAAGQGSSSQQQPLTDVMWFALIRPAKAITKESQSAQAVSDDLASVHHLQMASASPPHSQRNYAWKQCRCPIRAGTE